jgi:hypothetical protein
VLRYGFLTIKGITGGVNVEAPAITVAAAAARNVVQRISGFEGSGGSSAGVYLGRKGARV